MIINLNKFQSVKNITVDFTNNKPGVYFLLNINEKTPRYKRIKNSYIQDQNGNYVIDHGMDITERVTRVLIYVGESIYPIKRLASHYFEKNVDKKERKEKKGIGPIFTHVRILDKFKRFEYDSVRCHHEKLLVRKYLPYLNQASQLTENQKLIVLNSEGKLSPYDLFKPYLMHARDIFKAYKAWEIEDEDYIKKELTPHKTKNKAGLIHHNKRDPRSYRDKKGEKIPFGWWVNASVMRYHKKQTAASTAYNINYKKFIKLYDPDRYKKILIRDKLQSKDNYKKNKKYRKTYEKLIYKLRKEKNQPTLL